MLFFQSIFRLNELKWIKIFNSFQSIFVYWILMDLVYLFALKFSIMVLTIRDLRTTIKYLLQSTDHFVVTLIHKSIWKRACFGVCFGSARY